MSPEIVLNPEPLRGYIEGFYGRLFTWKERAKVVAALHQLKMNSYFYAPKEDARHRFAWREPYDTQWRNAFAEFCNAARGKGIDVIAGIAPGLDFDFRADAEDFSRLLAKAQQLLSDGAGTIALLMDDIDDDFLIRNGATISEGTAHAILGNRLADALQREILIVPRVYADEIAIQSPEYLSDFSTTIDQELTIVYCGENIVTETIEPERSFEFAANISNRVVAWDNLYANDYCPRRLFLGPWTGRDNCRDLLLNPTGMIETDLLLLEVMSACYQSTDKRTVWATVMSRNGVPDAFMRIAHHVDKPPFPNDDEHVVDTSIADQLLALDELLWRWKTPLSREWYPCLMGLRQDLMLSNDELPPVRIRKTQTPPMSGVILKLLEK